MSDERLRRLERASTQGDPAARAGLLSERMRTGALRPDRVRLAAVVGDPAALLAVGAPKTPPPGFPDALAAEGLHGGTRHAIRRRSELEFARAWIARIADAGGTPALVRAAISGVLAVADDVALIPEARAALGAATAWVEAVEAADARARASAWSPPDGSEGEGDPAVAEASTAAIAAGDRAALAVQEEAAPDPSRRDAGQHLTQAASLVAYAAGSTTRGTAAENVRHALQRAGAAWQLARPADDPDDESRTLRPAIRAAVATAIAAWALE